MKESQKIYIKGNKDRGDEIKDILTGRGAHTEYVSCDNEDYIYFITHENVIGIAVIGSEVAKIIMDEYKEIMLPPRKWKKGDILSYNGDNELYCSGVFAVFEKYDGKNTFDSHILIDSNGMRFGVSLPITDYHLANIYEKNDFSRYYNYMMTHLQAANDLLRKDME